MEKPKFGAGHVSAFMRQGLEELRNVVYPESNVAEPHTMYGIYRTQTPGEVATARREDAHSSPSSEPIALEEERGSVLGDTMKQVEANREAAGRDDREIERD